MASILAFLTGLLGPLGDFIVKLLGAARPDPAVIEAEKAGAAERAVTDMESADVQARSAARDRDGVAHLVADRTGLHDFEASDPNNRDNAAG